MDDNTIKLFGSRKTDHWATPPEIWEYLKLEFGRVYDPCPINPIEDGLNINWKPITFVNPPYSKVKEWLLKAHKELKKGNSHTIIFLLYVNTDTVFFQDLILPYAEIRYIRGRVKFISLDGKKAPAMRPSALIIFKRKWTRELKSL